MTPTEQLRQRVTDHLGGRFDHEKRSLRAFAAESGVGFNTIARFVRGRQITSDVFDRLSLAVEATAPAVASDVEAIRRALDIGFISWDGDGWYAKDKGYDYEDAQAAFDAAYAALLPAEEE